MSFNVEDFKGVDTSVLDSLQSYIQSMEKKVERSEEKAKKAEDESANQRKTLKSEVEASRKFKETVFDRLNINSEDEFETAINGTQRKVDESKLSEKALKKLQDELKAEKEVKAEYESKYKNSLIESAIAREVSKYPWNDAEAAYELIKNRAAFNESGEVVFKQKDGTEIEFTDGVKSFSVERTGLLKAAGTTSPGTGWNGKGVAGGKTFKEMSWPERQELFIKDRASYDDGMKTLNTQ